MAKKIIKITGYVLLIAAIALIILRVVYADVNTVFTKITPTDGVKSAFASGAEILTHKTVQEIADDGYMKCYALVYIPSENELQISVKFNKSIYDHVGSGELFDFKLYNTSDESEVWAKSVERTEKGLYGYCRVVFENVTIEENEALEIVMTSADRLDDYSVYRIHEDYQDFKPYKLSGSEKAQIGG